MFLQMVDPLEITYPPGDLIKSLSAQMWLIENMFDIRQIEFLPTTRYVYCVMKKVLKIITEAIEDPEEDVRTHVTVPRTFLAGPVRPLSNTSKY